MQLAFSKHLFIGTRHVVNKSGTSKKKGNYNSAHKNSRKVWKIVGFINSSKST